MKAPRHARYPGMFSARRLRQGMEERYEGNRSALHRDSEIPQATIFRHETGEALPDPETYGELYQRHLGVSVDELRHAVLLDTADRMRLDHRLTLDDFLALALELRRLYAEEGIEDRSQW